MPEAVIVGVGETRFTKESDLTDEELIADAMRFALHDAGLRKSDVNGLAIGTMSLKDDVPLLAEHFGLSSKWLLKADYGGASGVVSVARARQAIEGGFADVVVTAAGGNKDPNRQHDRQYPMSDYSRRSWVEPFGYGGPNSFFGLMQQLHMSKYGTTLEQLGKIATTFRSHAQLNDNALLQKDLSIDDYKDSRLISDPIRLLDCVMPCCGAAAIVIAREDIASQLQKPGIRVASYGESSGHQAAEALPDRLDLGFSQFRDRLFQNIPGTDMDFLQLYDDYPIAVLMTLEALGYAETGKGGLFLEETDISVGGELPINTGGGQLSIGQPTMAGGYIHVVEAVRQLRNEAGARQVEDARQGLVTGIGLVSSFGNVAVTAAMILSAGAK